MSKTGVQTAVFGTPKFIYAQPSLGGNPQATIRSPQPGNAFANWPLNTGDGPKRAAVTFDGTHYIIVAGNWLGGLWRYVEP
jgi:hypothetical protein